MEDADNVIRSCSMEEKDRIYHVVNDAALAYEGFIPPDRYQAPYMPMMQLLAEMAEMTMFGWIEEGQLVGVMSHQPVKDVTLIRHAYVLNAFQKKGIGSRLLDHIIAMTSTQQLLVGTWAAATWAVAFYEGHGFRMMPNKDELLRTYWHVPDRQIETSVVLGLELPGLPD
ncbi:MAG: GNAT family N-acetyltransferase [Dehalococcoidia bacterium]|nr:GNAT family N-acetyltransferase [Dehalococcoidia bacterium]